MFEITLIQVFDFIGTLAFAISGIRLASAKHFDLFGAYVVGVTTAIGGGTMRDVLLGQSPFWMSNSFYLICSAIALAWVIIFRKLLVRQNNTWFLFDTIGLALFTVTGVEKTITAGFPFWTAIIMGTLTGAGGGVLRDVFINEEPLIFRKEIYALACVLGGIAYFICARCGIGTVLAGVLPDEKEAKVRQFMEEGRKVAMVGDGINDAPALVTADVGLAIGAGTDVAIESADIVLMRSSLMDIVDAAALSRATLRNIRQNLFWAFFYNAIGIPVAAGALYPAFGITLNPMIAAAAMSLSSVCVVSNALRLGRAKLQ